VGSWLRIIDPKHPSQLASLMMDVRGAADYEAGRTIDSRSLGLSAAGLDVTVDLDRPGSDFPSIVASPTFGIVPPAVWRDGTAIRPGAVAMSGGYSLAAFTPIEITLKANSHYWAGTPAIGTVHLLLSIEGRSPVAAFQSGDVDYTAISSADAGWIGYDTGLGPQLRRIRSLSLSYLGFTADRPPFSDLRVRQAFGAAVDWKRIGILAADPQEVPADSMVPPGIPGAGTGGFLPTHDPALARRLLADAGYPGGAGLPPIEFAAGGLGLAEGIAADLERELGVTIKLEEFDDHFGHLSTDPAPMWTLGWVADYPGANDFLGVLLGTGSANNYGRWSSPAFDSAIADALATRDSSAAMAGFTQALAIVRDDVPAVPLLNGDGWALSRSALLGADENGLGILRLAGLAWK
jgi:oligopeptide transport system substrate-binding protein